MTDPFGFPQTFGPHLTAADVWEEIHRQTGLPIIADSYSRLYPTDRILSREAPLFDALCRAADAMDIRWKKEGDFVQCRSVSFFWDKLKEVPNALLERWRRDSLRKDGLPLDDLLDIAALSDFQLDAAQVGEAVQRCWGIAAWSLLLGRNADLRRQARLLGHLAPEERHRVFEQDGLLLSALNPASRQEWVTYIMNRTGFPPEDLAGLRLKARYIPSGRYVWFPQGLDYSLHREASKFPVIADTTPQGALAAALQIYPGATANQVRRSGPLLIVTLLPASERLKEFDWSYGKPQVSFLPPKPEK